MKTIRSILLWILALILTFLSAHYQRSTGPTYPLDGEASLGGQSIHYALLRTHETTGDQPVLIDVGDTTIHGEVIWKRYKLDEPLRVLPLQRETLTADQIGKLSGIGHTIISNRGKSTGSTRSVLIGYLPKQPAAGKLEYKVALNRGAERVLLPQTGSAVVTRFKGDVPPFVLLPHILCMFTGLFFAMRILLGALLKEPVYRKTLITTILLIVGGFVLGPLVQKYAFDAFWTGWPFGEDLTDNKTALMILAWVLAVWQLRKPDGERRGRWWAVAATIIMSGIYLIPHSMRGSELDYSKLPRTNQDTVQTSTIVPGSK